MAESLFRRCLFIACDELRSGASRGSFGRVSDAAAFPGCIAPQALHGGPNSAGRTRVRWAPAYDPGGISRHVGAGLLRHVALPKFLGAHFGRRGPRPAEISKKRLQIAPPARSARSTAHVKESAVRQSAPADRGDMRCAIRGIVRGRDIGARPTSAYAVETS